MTGRSTYRESAPFVEASPRPKRRKPRQPKPGAQAAPQALLHVLEDPTRGLALIRGRGVRQVLIRAGKDASARWSESAKGYVVDLTDLADVIAAAEHSRAIVRTKTMDGAA